MDPDPVTDVLIRSGTPVHRHRRMLPGKVPERAGNDRSPGRGAKTADQLPEGKRGAEGGFSLITCRQNQPALVAKGAVVSERIRL